MKRLFTLIILVLVFISCSTDVELNADYKDITIVYGLLDKNSKYQYIKINKAFLGYASVAEMASVSDSFNYNLVDVSILKYRNDNYVRTIHFEYTDTIQKESGFFANDKNIIYISDEKLVEDNEHNKLDEITYKLEVKVPNKDIVTSTTKLVGDVKPADIPIKTEEVAFYSSYGIQAGSYIIHNNNYINADNAYMTDVTITCYFFDKYNYEEFYKLDSVEFRNDIFVRTYYNNFGQKLKMPIFGADFYLQLHDAIKENKTNTRVFYCLRFCYNYSGFKLTEYIEQNILEYSTVNSGQAYTNITNGYGVFSSRSKSYSDYKFLDFHSGSLEHLHETTSPTSSDRFLSGTATLKFYDYSYNRVLYDPYELYSDWEPPLQTH